MGQFFNWPPFVAVAIDADTGKPVDPNIGMRTRREFYNVGKNSSGRKLLVAHKTGSGSAVAAAAAAEAGKKGSEKGKKGSEEKGKKNAAAAAGDAGGDELKKDKDAPFTAEDDEVLKRMKGENKSWKEIVEVLGRNQHVLKTHWKEINEAGGNDAKAEEKKDGGGKKGGKGNDEGKNDNANTNNNKKDKENKKDKPTKADQKPEPTPSQPASVKAPSVAGSNGQARFTMQEWRTLQEDDFFSFGELQCLSELMLRDERQRWLRVASAFYDKTGRRVHPEDIREKFAEMGGGR